MASVAPINFENVDALRKRMLLSAINIASLFGVSRVTYYNWLKGRMPRDLRAKKVREVLRKLFACIETYHWPTPEALMANQKDRIILLEEILKKLDESKSTVLV